jgi:hypothetical protein
MYFAHSHCHRVRRIKRHAVSFIITPDYSHFYQGRRKNHLPIGPTTAPEYHLRTSPHPRTSRPTGYNLTFLSRSAFVTTETDDKDMAAPASMGLSKAPVSGYNSPAAMGTPAKL